MSTHRLFSSKADLYATARPTYPTELYDYLASVTPKCERALDCACGNGQVALDLIKHFDRVDAIDVSEEQIAQAPSTPGVYFSVGEGEATRFDQAAFDLICVGQALHWFDYVRFWPEVDRILKPGGVFAAWGYVFFNSESDLEQLFEENLYRVIQPYWSERNRLLWDHYRNVAIPYRKVAAPKFRLAVEWNFAQLLGYIRTWSAVQRCVDAQGEDFYVELCGRVGEIWGDRNRRRTIEMDFCFVATQKEA